MGSQRVYRLLIFAALIAGCSSPTSLLVELDGHVPDATGVVLSVILKGGLGADPMKLPSPGSGAPFKLPGTIVVSLDDDVGKVKLAATAVDLNDDPVGWGF